MCCAFIFLILLNLIDSFYPQIAVRSGSYIRFHWLDDEDEKSFFELRISSSELTGATMLVITDFAYPDEMADSRGLWDHQIETLRRKLGV